MIAALWGVNDFSLKTMMLSADVPSHGVYLGNGTLGNAKGKKCNAGGVKDLCTHFVFVLTPARASEHIHPHAHTHTLAFFS